MKKLITFCLVLICSVSLMAQEHMTFIGIPITGKITSVKTILESKGFKYTDGDVDRGIYLFDGRFINEDVTVCSYATPISKTIYIISVRFDEKSTYSSIMSQYEGLVESLTIKYGNPSNSYEDFLYPFEKGDGHELTAIQSEKTQIYTIWISDLGFVICDIQSNLRCSIVYGDKIGHDLNKNEEENVNQNQL